MSATAVETETEAKPKKLPEARRINGICFVHPTFASARSAVSISDKSCLSITPVTMGPDGECSPIKEGQAPVGFLVRRMMTNPHPHVARDFIPWANITNVTYSE